MAYEAVLEERNALLKRDVEDRVTRVDGVEARGRQVHRHRVAHLELHLRAHTEQSS